MLHVIFVRYIDNYYLELVFDNGTKGIINLYPHLKGSIFEPLQDKNLFNKVTIDEESQTISWSNGADFTPEFLKENLESV